MPIELAWRAGACCHRVKRDIFQDGEKNRNVWETVIQFGMLEVVDYLNEHDSFVF